MTASPWSMLPAGLLEEEVVDWLRCADLPPLASTSLRTRHLAADAVWQRRLEGLPEGLLAEVPLGRTDQTLWCPSALRRRTAALEARAALTFEQRQELDYEMCVSCYEGLPCWQLLRRGASVLCMAGGQTPLIHAAASGNVDAIWAVLASGASFCDPNIDGDAALPLAVLHNQADAVRALVAAGADIEEADCHGDTPLLAAAAAGNAEMVQVLVDLGADIETTDADGDTALLCAIVNGQLSVVQLLLDSGADVDGGDRDDGETPLMRAASEGNAAIVRTLLAAGADVHATHFDGFTPLIFAAITGSADAVDALVALGSDLEACGRDGATALMHALSNGHDEVARILVAAGAVGGASPARDRMGPPSGISHDYGCGAPVCA